MAPLMTDDVPALIDANAAHRQSKLHKQMHMYLQIQIQIHM